MNDKRPWEPFEKIVSEKWRRSREYKERTGCVAVGHLLPDVPEELIHAVGGLPVALWGAGVELSHAQAHIPSYTCSHAMGALELGFREELNFLDAAIIPYVCDTTRNLFHIWQQCFPSMKNEFLRLPKRLDYPGARVYLRREYERLFAFLKTLTGSDAGVDELSRSIALFNKGRGLLRRAYGKLREDPSAWTQSKVIHLFESWFLTPKEEHIAMMEKLPWDSKAAAESDERILLYVRGKVWDPPAILALLDELKFVLAGDEVVTGYRVAAVDASLEQDPFDALVERFMRTPAYPGYHFDPERMRESFLERVVQSGAQGVLFLNPKFCEAAGFDTPDFQKALEEKGIPSIVLETSTRGVSLEQLRVRLEAFREMMSEDLP